MTHKLNNLKQEGETIRLAHAEKVVLRERIFSAIGTRSPIQPERSPYIFMSLFHVRVLVPLLVMFLVIGGSGTAFAAEGSLPGDALWTIKVNVNEKIQEALATTPKAKAQVHADLAERRIEEAETLAANGKLSAQLSDQVETNFDEHVAKADKLAQDDSDKSDDVGAELDSTLAAHGEVLAVLGQDSDDADTKDHSEKLANKVLAHASLVNKMTLTTDADLKSQAKVATFAATDTAPAPKMATTETATVTATNTVNQKVASGTNTNKKKVSGLEKKARERVDAAHKQFAGVTLDATTTLQVEAQMKNIDQMLTDSNWSGALGASIKFQAFLKTEKKFNKKVLPLINVQVLGVFDEQSSTSSDEGNTGTTSTSSNEQKGKDGEDGKNGSSSEEHSSSSKSNVEIHLDL